MNDKTFKPPSLAQLFDAPEEYRGSFAWLCGYSADAGFLDDAAARFMCQTRGQRSYAGRIAIALMLDPGNPQIYPIEAPGVLHLPFQNDRKPFALLHARIGVLGFCHATDARRWCLRVIVSTGNWTRQTLE